MKIKSQLLRGIGANGFAQAVNIIVQIGSVPIFISFWGVDVYGLWLLLCTIPSYLSVIDGGFSAVAATRMTMLTASDDKTRALIVFNSTLSFLSMIATALACFGVALLTIGPELGKVIATTINVEIYETLGWLILYSSATIYAGMWQAGFRCDEKFALGVVILAIVRFMEFLALMAAVVLGCTIVEVAAVLFGFKLIAMVVIYLILIQQVQWLEVAWRHVDLSEVKGQMIPSLAYAGIPLGHALRIQGVLIIIAASLGTREVAVFSVVRTLANVVSQMTFALCHAFGPQISVSFANNDLQTSRLLHRIALATAFWCSVALSGILLVAHKDILAWWTASNVSVEALTMFLLLSSGVLTSIWYPSLTVLLSRNIHSKFAVDYIAAILLAGLVCILVIDTFGLLSILAIMILLEGVIIVLVLPRVVRLLRDDLLSIVVFFFNFRQLTMFWFGKHSQ